MDQQELQARRDYYSVQPRLDGGDASMTQMTVNRRYIAYPRALALLEQRLNAVPEEVAAWVFLGPGLGGLSAYLNANELDEPPTFYYNPDRHDNFDYVSPLMGCWFREDDIAQFKPAARFITGKELIERWSVHPGVQPEAFIHAKITESRLTDMHPISGETQGTNPGVGFYPPLICAFHAIRPPVPRLFGR